MWFRVDARSRNPTGTRRGSNLVAATPCFVVALCPLWTGAWLLANSLEARCGWASTGSPLSFYWVGMKLLLWVGPSLPLINFSGRSAREVVIGDGVRGAK